MKTILIIDDNADIRENVAEILEFDSYKTLTAENGKEGVHVARNEYPDLILCDIMMPVLDGFGVFIELNKDPYTAGIPFVFLTALSELSDKTKGLNLGADDYIVKPFSDELLLSTVSNRIQKSEETRDKMRHERESYMAELEHMLHMTSHRIRKPVCSILGLMQLVDLNKEMDNATLHKILTESKNCAGELDDFTRELTLFLDFAKQKRLRKTR